MVLLMPFSCLLCFPCVTPFLPTPFLSLLAPDFIGGKKIIIIIVQVHFLLHRVLFSPLTFPSSCRHLWKIASSHAGEVPGCPLLHTLSASVYISARLSSVTIYNIEWKVQDGIVSIYKSTGYVIQKYIANFRIYSNNIYVSYYSQNNPIYKVPIVYT